MRGRRQREKGEQETEPAREDIEDITRRQTTNIQQAVDRQKQEKERERGREKERERERAGGRGRYKRKEERDPA